MNGSHDHASPSVNPFAPLLEYAEMHTNEEGLIPSNTQTTPIGHHSQVNEVKLHFYPGANNFLRTVSWLTCRNLAISLRAWPSVTAIRMNASRNSLTNAVRDPDSTISR